MSQEEPYFLTLQLFNVERMFEKVAFASLAGWYVVRFDPNNVDYLEYICAWSKFPKREKWGMSARVRDGIHDLDSS